LIALASPHIKRERITINIGFGHRFPKNDAIGGHVQKNSIKIEKKSIEKIKKILKNLFFYVMAVM